MIDLYFSLVTALSPYYGSRAHLTLTLFTAISVQANRHSNIGTSSPHQSHLSCSLTRRRKATTCCSFMGECTLKRVAAPHSHAAQCNVVVFLIAMFVHKLSDHLATNLSLRAIYLYRLGRTLESWFLITAHSCRFLFSGCTRRSQMRSRCTLEPKHGENKSLNTK